MLAADIPWLDALIDALTGAERDRAWNSLKFARADAGAFVCRQGERIAGWLGLLDGLVRVASTDQSGCTTTITGILAGGWFGEGTVLKRESRRFHAEALGRCRLVRALLANSLRFNRLVMDQLNERLSQFIAAREWERLRRPDLRVAWQLAQLHNPVLHPRAGTVVKLRQQELADLAGLSRQCVCRSLAQLQEHGLVRVQYGGVQVLDAAALAREVRASHG